MKRLIVVLFVCALFVSCTNKLPRKSFFTLFPPVCSEQYLCSQYAYSDSYICKWYKGDARWVIMDPSDAAGVDPQALKEIEEYLPTDMITYTQVFTLISQKLGTPMSRYKDMRSAWWMKLSDKQLLLASIQAIRNEAGIK